MKSSIGFLAILVVVAGVMAAAPVVARDEVNAAAPPLLAPQPSGNGVLTLDRNYDRPRPTPQPIVPPDKDPKPGRLLSAPSGPSGSTEGAGFGSAILGGSGSASSKEDLLEKSLRTTAEKLR